MLRFRIRSIVIPKTGLH